MNPVISPFALLKFLLTLLVIAGAVLSPHDHAALTIEIVGSGTNQIPLAIAPFRAEEGIPQQLTPIITAIINRRL